MRLEPFCITSFLRQLEEEQAKNNPFRAHAVLTWEDHLKKKEEYEKRIAERNKFYDAALEDESGFIAFSI